MSSPQLPGDKPLAVSWRRVAVWIAVGGVGLFLVITGLAGVIAKG